MPSSDLKPAVIADPVTTEAIVLAGRKPGRRLRERPAGRPIKLDRSDYVLRGISYVTITLFALFCLLPFVLIVSASFSSESEIMKDGFGLLPKGFTLTAYEYIFKAPRQIIGSYVVTIVMTVTGTARRVCSSSR